VSTQDVEVRNVKDEEKRQLNKRLETIGWALFLIMVGGIALVPDERVPEGIWSIGVGLILLGLNAARKYYGIKMSGGTIILGFIALVTGVGDMLGVDLPVLEILLIVVGLNMLYKGWQSMQGKGKQSE
jgi:hypothetical protein